MQRSKFVLAGIAVITLLLSSASSLGGLKINSKNESFEEYELQPSNINDFIDQRQWEFDGWHNISGITYQAQSFKPSYGKLTKIDLRLSSRFSGVMQELFIYICDSLNPWNHVRGFLFVVLNLPQFPDNHWVMFNFADIEVCINQTYYIVVISYEEFSPTCEWWYSSNNPYHRGSRFYNPNSYHHDDEWIEFPDQDFSFNTYGAYIPNRPPNKPTIRGASKGVVGSNYTYNFTSLDPDDDQVRFFVKWGDGTETGWTDLIDSDKPYSISHSYDKWGSYNIQAKSRDESNKESDWATLEVTIPKNKVNHLLNSVLEQLLYYLSFISIGGKKV